MRERSWSRTGLIISVLAVCLASEMALAVEPVTVHNIVRAETDTALGHTLSEIGSFQRFHHFRTLTPLDQQSIIRMNRDTLYSSAILDLSEPVTVTLPDKGGRYISLQVINQDHYMFVLTEPGKHVLTQDQVGSRYAQVIARVFVNPNDAGDVEAAHAAQDRLQISGGGDGPLEVPDWNQNQLQTAREAINKLATLGSSSERAFGTPETTDPLDHLIGAVAGWGGLPPSAAYYLIGSVDDTSGTPYSVTVKDVPVDAFWSITVYNERGFIEKNSRDAYSYNNITAKPDDDGAYTVHFGKCDDGRINCLPITQGWNYVVRLYEPRPQIVDGTWKFPAPQAMLVEK